MKGLAPSAATRADLSGSSRGSPADALGDLRVTVRASPPGTPRTSYSSRSEHPVRFLGDFTGLSHGAPSISFSAPSVDRMSIAASGDGFTSSEDEGAVGLPPSGVVATAAPDPELTAMLARAAVSIGLEVNRPPSPEPSRLDDWFLGAGRGSQPRPAPVPFFPEVHEELTSSWMAPFTARSRSSASSVLTTLDGGVARGYTGIPQVERAVAVHLCPRNAATWRNRPRLPSKACKLTAALAAKAYSAAGQAASALHAMAILQVHQAKALKQVHEGSTDPGLMQELRTATDFALRATKVTARSLGKAMSTMVVQERHLWLNLQRWRTSTRHAFSTPPSPREGCSATPSRASPSSSRRYSSRPRRSSTSCPGVMHHPPLPPGPGLSLPVAVGALLRPPEPLRPRPNRHIGRCVEPLAGERRPPRPSQAPSRPGSRRSGPDAGNPELLEFALSQETARTAPLLPPVEGREENLLFRFVSVPPLVQGPAVPTFSKKEQFPFPPGSQVHGTTVCDALPPHSRPRPILPVAKRVRFGDDIPPHAPLASPVRDPGSSVRMPQNAPPSVPSTPTPFRCTTTGTSIVPLEPLAQRLEAWLTLPSLSRWLTRTIRLGYAIQFARRPPKFNAVLETSVAVRNASVLRALMTAHVPRRMAIRLIWSRFGEAQVDLFASTESSHCQLYFSLTEGPLGTDALAHSWHRALRKYAFPPVSLLAQTLCKLREDEEQVPLVAPHWPSHWPHPGIRAPFSSPVLFPGRWTLVESSKHPWQSDWAEQSDARPSTGVSSPRSPVSPCTGLGVRMAWFPFG